MKTKIKCEALGDVQQTPKGGFIRQFLVFDFSGGKSVIKVYSKNKSDLETAGPHERVVETDNFCFAPRT